MPVLPFGLIVFCEQILRDLILFKSYSFSLYRQSVLVLFLCSHSAPDMAFRFVDVQNNTRLGSKGRVDLLETLRDVCWCLIRNKKF